MVLFSYLNYYGAKINQNDLPSKQKLIKLIYLT